MKKQNNENKTSKDLTGNLTPLTRASANWKLALGMLFREARRDEESGKEGEELQVRVGGAGRPPLGVPDGCGGRRG